MQPLTCPLPAAGERACSRFKLVPLFPAGEKVPAGRMRLRLLVRAAP